MAIDLVARFECLVGARDAALELLSDYARHVLASAGTQRFEIYTEREGPERIVVIERYTDEASFRAHLADPANGRFNNRLAPLIAGGASELTRLESVVDPK
jgi:quinol monooxygenase YgiN